MTYPPLSVATVYRWIQLFEAGGYDIRALIPHSHKQGRHKYTHPLVEEVMDATIQELYLKRESCRKKDVYLETQLRVDEKNSTGDITEPLKPPSYATVNRRINELDAEVWYRARYGKRAADAEFAQFEKTPLPTRPLVRVEIDHTRLDLILIDTADELPLGRPTLTTVIDTATRYPLGYYLGFEPASYLSVMEALSHAFRPKQNVREQYGTAHEWLAYGLPRTLVVDGGKEFRGRDLKDACLQLGIHLELAPKYAPEFKAVVERFFGTNNTGLIHTLDGHYLFQHFSAG